MKNWPSSVPDYQWPANYASAAMAPLRWALSATFYAGYALGRAVRSLTDRLNLPRYETKPTLVIRTDGIGDALLFEPALESLARSVSPSEVHLWAPRSTCQLFRECPTITRRLSIPRGCRPGNLKYYNSFTWRAKLGFELGRWSFERVVYPVESPEPLGNWLLTAAAADERWLNWGDTQNQFDWQQAKTHAAATRVIETRPGHAHEITRNEYLADQWAEEKRLRKPRVHLGPNALADANKLVTAWRRAADKMGANDLAGLVVAGTSRVNQYPPEHWATVLHQLWEQQRAVAVLLSGPNDRKAVDEVAHRLGDVPHFRQLKAVPLLTMSAIIRRLDGMLSVDTGLAHVALSMRVPTVVLVGGGHPGRFFPWPGNSQHVVLNVPMPCEGCQNRCHLPESMCVTRIRPDDIVEAYAKLRVRETTIERFIVPAMHFKKAAG